MREAAPAIGLGASVAIVQRYVPPYRRPFFTGLRRQLLDEGVRLELFHGEPPGYAASMGSSGLSWAHLVPTTEVRLGKRKLVWQKCLLQVKNNDLVIAEQATRMLINYPLLARGLLGSSRLALWGHGANLKLEDRNRMSEWIKRVVSKHVHWWFAYTPGGARRVEELGFPRNRITVVHNAIDTTEIVEALARADEADLDQLRNDLGIGSANVGLFLGSLYKEKRLAFLLKAARMTRELVPDFELLIVGAGPESAMVEQFAHEHPWAHVTGPHFGEDKARLLKLAKVVLVPGAVGLVVLDAFATGRPVITVAGTSHGPELEYLENALNGLVLPHGTSPDDFAKAIADLLYNERFLRELSSGAARSSAKYSLDRMIDCFSDGIKRALSVDAKH